MDSSTQTNTRNFTFAGADDELLEVVHIWALALPGRRDLPDDGDAIDPAAWAVARLEDGDYLWVGEPEEKRTDAGRLVRIDAPIRYFQRHLRHSGKMVWQLDGAGSLSIIVDIRGTSTQWVVSYPAIAIVDEMCGILVDMFADWTPDRTQAAPVQTGKPGNPGKDAHKRARERLRAGEDEKTVKDAWIEEYEDETGIAPEDTASGEKEMWRNVKRGRN